MEEPALLPALPPSILKGRAGVALEGRSWNHTIGGWVGVLAADICVPACVLTGKCWRMFGTSTCTEMFVI